MQNTQSSNPERILMCLGLPLQGLQILEISHRPYKINMHKMHKVEINTAIIKKDKHQKCSEINRNVWKNAIEMKTMIIRIKNLINGQLLDFPCRGQINHATSNIEKTRQSIWNKSIQTLHSGSSVFLESKVLHEESPMSVSAFRLEREGTQAEPDNLSGLKRQKVGFRNT